MQAGILIKTTAVSEAEAALAPLETAWDAAEVDRLAAEDTAAVAAQGAAWDEAKGKRDAEKTLLDEMQAEYDSW